MEIESPPERRVSRKKIILGVLAIVFLAVAIIVRVGNERPDSRRQAERHGRAVPRRTSNRNECWPLPPRRSRRPRSDRCGDHPGVRADRRYPEQVAGLRLRRSSIEPKPPPRAGDHPPTRVPTAVPSPGQHHRRRARSPPSPQHR